jgi:hypothetical protein
VQEGMPPKPAPSRLAEGRWRLWPRIALSQSGLLPISANSGVTEHQILKIRYGSSELMRILR